METKDVFLKIKYTSNEAISLNADSSSLWQILSEGDEEPSNYREWSDKDFSYLINTIVYHQSSNKY